MIQNSKREPLLYAPALDCSLSIYSRIGASTVEAIFSYVYEGVFDKSKLAHRSERWVIASYKELRTAECLADRWLCMDLEALYSVSLEGLDDFSLATYASVVQDRDAEESLDGENCVSGWDRAILAYTLLAQNNKGSDLIDYGWLYRDILEYQMVPDDDAYFQMLERVVAFEYEWGTDETIIDGLCLLACDWIETGKIQEGGLLLARMFESQFRSFEIFEEAVVAYQKIGQMTACKILMDGAFEASRADASLRHAYDDLAIMINLSPQPASPSNCFENRLANAVYHSKSRKQKISAKDLANELVPHLSSIPVKSIPQR